MTYNTLPTIALVSGFISLSIIFLIVYYLRRVKCTYNNDNKASLAHAHIEQVRMSSLQPHAPTRRFSFCRKTSTAPVAIPTISVSRYAEIPLTIQPLTPPRTVVLLEDIDTLLTEDVKNEVFMTKIRLAQNALKTVDASSFRCNMVIATHATADCVVGYCVNVTEGTCRIYTYHPTVLPWALQDKNDTLELGVKNLLFALVLWEKDIIKSKKVRLYVGREKMLSTEASTNCRQLVQHFKMCHKVEWVNEGDMWVNVDSLRPVGHGDLYNSLSHSSPRKLSSFDYFAPISEPDLTELFGISESEFDKLVQFVQPLEDLSSGRNKLAEEHLRNFFGLQVIYKTHCQKKWNKSQRRYWSETTFSYNAFLEQVQISKENWSKPCEKCGCQVH